MKPLEVTAAICPACCFADSYVSRENGAAPPGRWHTPHFANTIGAMSFVNVTGGFEACATVTGDVVRTFRSAVTVAPACTYAVVNDTLTKAHVDIAARGATLENPFIAQSPR
jgi:hypothetical protein